MSRGNAAGDPTPMDNFTQTCAVEPRTIVTKSQKAIIIERRLGYVSPSFDDASSKKYRRALRETEQRLAAKKRVHVAYKLEPKHLRESAVLAARDKRNPTIAFQSGCMLEDDVDAWQKYLTTFATVGLTAGATLLATQFWRTLRTTQSVTARADMILEQLQECKRNFMSTLGKHLWCVPLVMVVYFAVTNFISLTNSLYKLLLAGLAVVLGTQLWNSIADFFPDGDIEVTAFQSGLLGNLSRVLCTLMATSVFGCDRNTNHLVTEFMKRIAMIERTNSGFEAFSEWTVTAIEQIINYIRSRFGCERISLLKSVHQPMLDWVNKVDRKVEQHSTGVADITSEELNELISLVRDGHGFKEVYRGTTMSRQVDEFTMKISNVLHPYLGAITARNNFRFEPVSCMLLGAPGIGKTLLATPLCSTILLESGLLPPGSTPDQVMQNIWQKGTSEYWNSYASQLCLVMDDAFQQRPDPTDKDNEYMNLIRMIGTWSFPLNFADLTSKGKIFFGSKFVFGTTNLSCIMAEARKVINEPEAVGRRINFGYKLILKPEYSVNGRLCQDAYQRELSKCMDNNSGMDCFPWYIWEVQKHDFMTGRTDGVSVPLRDMVMEISMSLKQRAGTFTATKDFLCEYIHKLNDFNKPGFQAGRFLSGVCDSVVKPIRQLGSAVIGATLALSAKAAHIKITSLEVEHFKNSLDSFMRAEMSFMSCAEDFFGTAASLFTIAALAGLLYALMSGVKAMFSWLFGQKKVVVEEQSNRPLMAKPQKIRVNDVRLQTTDTTVCTNVYKNTYKMFARLSDDSLYVIGQVCFVCDSLVVQPHHFSDQVRNMVRDGELEAHAIVEFRHVVNNEHSFTMTVSKYLSFKRFGQKDADVEFVDFEDVRAHRNIVSSFMMEKDIRYLGGARGRLDISEVDDRKQLIVGPKRMIYTFPTMAYGENLRVSNTTLTRFFKYSAPTTAGDCGAPLSVFNNSSYSGRTTLGFHVCGAPARGDGYSNVVTQEMINKAIDHFNVVKDRFETDLADRGIKFQAGSELPFAEKGSFLPIGEVSKAVTICPKTSFYVTQHYGRIGEYDHLPAPLAPVYRDGQLVFPMENAVKPYSSPLLIYEQPWLEQAVHVAMRPLTKLTADYSRRLYSFEEAILGVPEEKFRSIPRGTAAGFPYVYEVKNGKKEFFGSGETYDLSTLLAQELRTRVCYVLDSAKNNERLAHVFVDFLKDELRSPAKVQSVATRLISSAPLDYTVAWRMYFGAFSSAVMRNHTISGMAPGICTFTEWDVLASALSVKGERVFDGDFKGFDSSEQPTIHRMILDYINRWYNDGEENARVRRVLWLDLCHSRHIGGTGCDQRFIYQWNKSLPSGHPFTTIVNSMYSLVTIVSAYISITGDYTGFWEHVNTVTYGDDNVSNVDDVTSFVFNQSTVAQALNNEFGLVYTSGKKDGKFVPWTSLDDVTFLKRHIVYDEKNWLCPLELESFLYTFYWCKNRRLEAKIFVDVVETALEELSLHDSSTWQKYAPTLERLLAEQGHVTRVLCVQKEYRMLVLSRADNWY